MDEEEGDTLVNVNIMDEERVEKNLKSLREIKAGGYNPYEEEIDPLTGDLSRKGNLWMYLFFPHKLNQYLFTNGKQSLSQELK